jgi:hypothetical protein
MRTVRSAGQAIYFTGLVLLAVGLPFWLLLMSMSQFILIGGWLIDGNFKVKINAGIRNPVLLAISGLYILHVAGLIYSSDLAYGLADLRVKLPLLLIPFTVATMPALSGVNFNRLLVVVVVSTFLSTVCSVVVWLGITDVKVNDIRDISIFISHIRLALIVCTCIVCCMYLITQFEKNRWIFYLLILWFAIFIFILQSLTGIILLFILSFFYALRLLKNNSGIRRGVILMSLLSASAVVIFVMNYIFIDSVAPVHILQSQLKNKTVEGNMYTHFPASYEVENGNAVWINVCEEELEKEWNKVSDFNYKGADLHGQELRVTLIRFLASKNLNKDGEALRKLTPEEVKAVEQGIANVSYINNNSLKARIKQLAFEYRSYYYSGNPSGHSIMQRLEFWKTAIYIFKKHPFIGAGTGDIKNEFETAYNELNTMLLPKFRLRAHNEYLTMFVTFGVFGGAYFVFSLLYPFIKLNKKNDFLYCGFFIILLLSMVSEDTPESQAGATFMAFFNSILLFHDYSRPLQT